MRSAKGSAAGGCEHIKATGGLAAQFELKTTAEGIARVFEISVEERG